MPRRSQPRPAATPAAAADRWSEWDRFVAAHRHGGFMQTSAWIRCRSGDGYDHMAVMLRDESGSIAGGAVVGRWDCGDDTAFYYIQEGPLLPDDPELAQAVMSGLLARLDQYRCDDPALVTHLRIEPRCRDGEWPAFACAGFAPAPGNDPYREPRHTRCIDLRLSEDARLAAMRRDGRYNVQVARRHGVTVVEAGGGQALDDFVAIREDTARRQGLGPRPRRYFADLLREFGSGAQLYFAELDGRRLATALIVRVAGRATYLFGGSLDERREVKAPELLLHETMNRLAAQGCSAYDLWGIAPPDEPGHRWAALSAFKRKFGGAEIAFVPTLDHVYDRPGYARFFERAAAHVTAAHGDKRLADALTS